MFEVPQKGNEFDAYTQVELYLVGKVRLTHIIRCEKR